MKIKLFLATLLIASAAHAATAFLKHSYVSGMNKVCVYDHLGDDYVITIPSHRLCPLTVRVE